MDAKMENQFQRFCREELTYLRGGVFRIVGNDADTDDVIQNALLRAYRNVYTFRGEANMRSWIYRIAVNCAFDLIRTRERRNKANEQYAANPPESKNAEVEKKLAALERAVGGLPTIYREAIVWGVLSDLGGKAAAERLGCSENTLYQRIHKAKEMLRKAMSPEVA